MRDQLKVSFVIGGIGGWSTFAPCWGAGSQRAGLTRVRGGDGGQDLAAGWGDTDGDLAWVTMYFLRGIFSHWKGGGQAGVHVQLSTGEIAFVRLGS